MNYESYVELQVGGPVHRPERVHEAQRAAIDHLFADIPKKSIVLDVGCGTGEGMRYIEKLGFHGVQGVELYEQKAEIAGAEYGDIAKLDFPEGVFDVIYCSHSFEHMLDPGTVLEKFKKWASPRAFFIFILPYPDLDPNPPHCAAHKIGTNVDDNGGTVAFWFESRGLRLVEMKFDDRREPEIWLKFKKDKQ